MSKAPIIPVKQASIEIAGGLFIAVLLSNGETGLVLSQLCEFLGLHTNDQAQRLRIQSTLSTALALVEIETPGGPQATNVLLSWGIILWLERIRHGRRPPIYRERLLVFQRDARAALSKEFFKDPSEEPAPPKREKQATSLEKSPSVLEALQMLQRAVAADHQARAEEMRAVKQEQQAMQARLRRLEANIQGYTESNTPDESLPLTGKQYYELVSLLRKLQKQTGIPLETLATVVADHCGADHLTAIPQAAWPEALAWVKSRLGSR